MFERFTERARQVVVLAQDECRLLKHDYIGTEHLLLGLLREDEGLASRVLQSLDITVDEVRLQISRHVPPGTEDVAGHRPFTADAKSSLELSLREALSLGHNYIGTEHILLGFMRETQGLGFRILAEFGVTPDVVRNEVIRHLAGPGRAKLVKEVADEVTTRLDGRPGPVYNINTPPPHPQGIMPLLRNIMQSIGEPGADFLDEDELQRIGSLALQCAGIVGLTPEWRTAYTKLADSASTLLTMAEQQAAAS